MRFKLKIVWKLLFLISMVPFVFTLANAKTETHLFKCKGVNNTQADTLEVPKKWMSTAEAHKFKLVQSDKDLPCNSSQRLLYSLPWNDSMLHYEDNNFDVYVTFLFNREGILTIDKNTANVNPNDGEAEVNVHTYHYPADFCIQKTRDEEENITLSVCNMEAECPKEVVGNKPPCIRKCCSNMNDVLTVDENGDVVCGSGVGNYSQEEIPFRFESLENKFNAYHHSSKRLQPKYFSDDFMYGEDCISHALQVPDKVYSGEYHSSLEVNVFHLEDGGKLSMCIRGKWLLFSPENFCIDALYNFGLINGESGNISSLMYIRCNKNNRGPSSLEATKTKEDHVSGNGAMETLLYAVTVPIASFFLFLVILVYVLLWDKQNIHGYTIFFYVISLFFFYIFIVIGVHISIGTQFCKFVAIAGHFSVISTFTWLTTVGFNIWRTFRQVRISSKADYLIRICKYGIFSWSIPLVIVTVGLILDHTQTDSQNKFVCSLTPLEDYQPVSPKYGVKSCTVIEEAQGVFMYYIAGLLLVCNLLFYSMTVFKLHQYRKETTTATQGDQSVFWLFGKLFIVMGICWIFEFIGWLVKRDNPNAQGVIAWFIWSMDIVVVLQAFALFVIFVCKRTIFEQLWEKYPMLRSFLSLFAACGCRSDENRTENQECDTKATLNSKETSHVTLQNNTMKYNSIPTNK